MSTEQCTLDTCPESAAVYGYRPNLGINVFFTVVFGLVALWSLIVTAWKRRWISYGIILAVGAVLELVGYLCRALSNGDPFDVDYFSIQFTLLTLAPVFTSASIYLSLKYLATNLGRGHFNISPKFYTAFFIPSDVIALIIQAVGGGLATSESTSDNPPPPSDGLLVGTKITIAGLALQVVSLCTFLILFIAVAVPKRQTSISNEPKSVATNGRRPLYLFMFMLLVATVLILIRSSYRVAELSQGLASSLATDQWLFVGLDGFMVAIAMALMVILSPALILPA
ncbi:RTA1 like protein [Hypoxylon trugodes]|uniref:RTA1 like protein n=1 Tax=Hypoxylon trugodes TaxID=326681 RepID=UPI00219D4D1A|nr:RTA1 like protein [Hypoxylon trugodes]KAI1390766.1 RTA1 like protein [Hypoxylon trugodes]